MRENEILKLIEKKSQPTQTIFSSLYKIMGLRYDIFWGDVSATLCYNYTLLLIKTIIENPTFMITEYDVRKEDIPSFIEDYKNMSEIDCPNEFDEDDMKKYEGGMRYRFSIEGFREHANKRNTV